MFLPHISPDLLKSVTGNQFTAGALIMTLFASVIAWVKGIPAKIWALILRQTTVTITIVDNDHAFNMVKGWVRELPFAKKARRVDVAYRAGATAENGIDPLRLNMGPGMHLFWYHHRPVWFYFTRAEKQNSRERTEAFTFRTIGRTQNFVIQMMRDIIRAYWACQSQESRLYKWTKDGWYEGGSYTPRTLDSVILAAGH
jgi:hypothetical protein